MKQVSCYITFRDIALCQIGSIDYYRFKRPICGYKSLADAKRSIKKLQKLDWGFKIIRGKCPNY